MNLKIVINIIIGIIVLLIGLIFKNKKRTIAGSNDVWYTEFEKENNIKVLKTAGSGGNGTVYLVERDGKKLILKVEKMDMWDKDKPLTSEYFRQIEFNKVAKKYPNKFMVLEDHGVIKDCKYVHPYTDKYQDMEKDFAKIFKRKNKQSDCYWLLYSPYLDGDYDSVIDTIRADGYLYYEYLHQITDSINILRKHGYSQNDLNGGNIMYKKISDTEYQWYIIDYGLIMHKSFPLSQMDKDLIKRYGDNDCDLFQFLLEQGFVEHYLGESDDIYLSFDAFIKRIRSIPALGKCNTHEKLQRCYKNYMKYIKKNQKKPKNNKIKKEIKKT